MSSISLVAAALFGTGGLALLLREWLWLRYCQHVYDVAVEHDQNPDPEKMIKVAGRGRLSRSTDRKQLTTGHESGKKAAGQDTPD
jgi:hypothetical protein